jgi:C-terminal processing protease CtpA/Prc
LTAGEGFESVAPTSSQRREEISFKELDGGYGYIQWGAFDDPLYKLAVWERFLTAFQAAPGIVIDLRDNGGGNLGLLYTMASFLFSAEKPAPEHWIDSYVYDEQANDLVREFATDYMLSSPKPELTYLGPVVVLVNENSASAAEYFPQFLQRQGRAIVVGEHGTDGAGGVIERASLPGSITFQFTKGRNVFAGTDEYNLEGKGVTLDVRVPITEESEQAKLDGRDPVLEAALEALGEEAARLGSAKLVGNTWQLLEMVGTPGAPALPPTPDNYNLTFAENGTLTIQTDCNAATAEYVLGGGGAITITPTTTTLAACPDGSIAEEFVRWLAAATTFQVDGEGLAILMDPETGVTGMAFVPVE